MDNQKEYFISYTNLRSGLFKFQKEFLNPKELNNFYDNKLMGMPICLPKNINFLIMEMQHFF